MRALRRWRGLVALVRDGVEHGSRAVEKVHLETAERTFAILEADPRRGAARAARPRGPPHHRPEHPRYRARREPRRDDRSRRRARRARGCGREVFLVARRPVTPQARRSGALRRALVLDRFIDERPRDQRPSNRGARLLADRVLVERDRAAGDARERGARLPTGKVPDAGEVATSADPAVHERKTTGSGARLRASRRRVRSCLP